MTKVEVLAPAKINLTLHVTGQRADGYHLLDSLVAFAPVSDRLVFEAADDFSLTVTGPEAAGVPTDDSNLVLRAAEIFRSGGGASITLDKFLPPAAGIGGGSADAAATIRALLLRDVQDHGTLEKLAQAPDDQLRPMLERILALGADVPMCLMPKTLRARGTGEKVEFVDIPAIPALLLNPRIAVPTPAVFANLKHRDNTPMPEIIPEFPSAFELVGWLANQRNDLQDAAIAVEPVVARVLATLKRRDGCQLARMSGSGATCFALFLDQESAIAAGQAVQHDHPDWWLAGGHLGSWDKRAAPRIN